MDITSRTPSPPPVSPLTPEPSMKTSAQADGVLLGTLGCIEQGYSGPTASSFNTLGDTLDGDDPVCETRREPQTPTRKTTRTLWYGLPSPLTPAIRQPCLEEDSINQDSKHKTSISTETDSSRFDDQLCVAFDKQQSPGDPSEAAEILQSEAIDSESNNGDSQHDSEKSQSPDTTIDTPPESRVRTCRGRHASPEPVLLRRSTRIAQKPSCEDQSIQVKSPKKKEEKTPSAPTVTWATPSTFPYDFSITQDNISIPLSTEWQLQYSPGGSTHPSYPWPNSDPRLTFHAHFVPLIDNLPDTAQVSKLLLPMGWRQISWSGLLPVVFDPYHQAFKLTPMGPMPLTAEELQQGGLYRYTPGGDMHPETDMLPDMSLFSDGSDADAYNFEGVECILPQYIFQGSTISEGRFAVKQFETGSAFPRGTNMSVEPLSELRNYDEACDCPDDIVDLEDAWRWMMQKEHDPRSLFNKSPGKTWLKSGVVMSKRKWKQPIPLLIAQAMTATEEGKPPFLGKQNKREFCPIKSVVTPVSVDISLLEDVEFTLMEFLCYFPLHFVWSKGAERLSRANATAAEMTYLINMTRGLSDTEGLVKGTVYRQVFFRNKTDAAADPDQTPSSASPPAYSAASWTHDALDKTDYPLLGLAHGLRVLPSGPDAGPLTALIVQCRADGRYQTMLSEVPRLLEEAGIKGVIEAGDGEPDKEVMLRHAEAVAEFRRRMKAEVGAEGAEDRGRKRKKVE